MLGMPPVLLGVDVEALVTLGEERHDHRSGDRSGLVHDPSPGNLQLDDYGAFPGTNKAIDEFLADRKVRIQKLPYSHAISFVEKG